MSRTEWLAVVLFAVAVVVVAVVAPGAYVWMWGDVIAPVYQAIANAVGWLFHLL